MSAAHPAAAVPCAAAGESICDIAKSDFEAAPARSPPGPP